MQALGLSGDEKKLFLLRRDRFPTLNPKALNPKGSQKGFRKASRSNWGIFSMICGSLDAPCEFHGIYGFGLLVPMGMGIWGLATLAGD